MTCRACPLGFRIQRLAHDRPVVVDVVVAALVVAQTTPNVLIAAHKTNCIIGSHQRRPQQLLQWAELRRSRIGFLSDWHTQRMCERGKRGQRQWPLFLFLSCCCHYPLGRMARCGSSYPAVVRMKSGQIGGRSKWLGCFWGEGEGGLDLISETSYSGQAVKSIPSGKRAKEQVQRVRHRWPDHPPRTKRLPPLSALTDQTAGSSVRWHCS